MASEFTAALGDAVVAELDRRGCLTSDRDVLAYIQDQLAVSG
ncbi:MAG TPA: hypothetical protein VKA58_03685 [Propionibacteriaceae bacterium]|nr:hypothetical protein [Propionibacteriaceae bacterium]